MTTARSPLARTMAVTLLATGFAVLGALAAQAHEYKAGTIEIGHPWTRATPKGADAAVGYLTIENGGAASDVLIGITMAGAKTGTVHEMKTENGKMTMEPLPEGLAIEPGQTMKLAPGTDHHIMFEGLRKPLKEGDKVSGTLVFRDAGAVNVFWKVEAMGAKEPAPMPGMKMDGGHH